MRRCAQNVCGLASLAFFVIWTMFWDAPQSVSESVPSAEAAAAVVRPIALLRNFPAPQSDSSREYDAAAVQPTAKPLAFFDQIACKSALAQFANEKNIREGGRSDQSGSSNRQRQIALGMMKAVAAIGEGGGVDRFLASAMLCISSLDGLKINILNTDANAALHQSLNKLSFSRYVASEYFPGEAKSGVYKGSIRHEDLQAMSFSDNSFHLVLSTEVFEHIPDPYKAHAEVFRVLRPGGAHVFTVPFSEEDYKDYNDIVMARLHPNGSIKHGPGKPPRFVPPHYHGDPIRKEGILVFTIFCSEMLVKLAQLGFKVDIQRIWDPHVGILGPSNLLFTAWKPL